MIKKTDVNFKDCPQLPQCHADNHSACLGAITSKTEEINIWTCKCHCHDGQSVPANQQKAVDLYAAIYGKKLC